MNKCIKKSFVLPMLVAGLGLMMVGEGPAQTFTNLYNFTGGSDGGHPVDMVSSGNVLFGATGKSTLGPGTLFTVNTDGTGFTTTYSFTDGGDGAGPGGLILSNGKLYGATSGGSSVSGTVFAINADGTGFTTLYTFTASNPNSDGFPTNSDGAEPGGLILSGNTIYGTAGGGGAYGYGTVFKLNTDGSGFSTLHTFTALTGPRYVNTDGGGPGNLQIASGTTTLYGIAGRGGSSGSGTVFALNTDGSVFKTLHSFTAVSTYVVNSDGYAPSSLFLSGNVLYGTALRGGSSAWGTVFAVNTDGSGFKTLHSFTGTDGAAPRGFILSGHTLFGTAGTVFKVNTDGTGFTTLYSFTAPSAPPCPCFNNDGASPDYLILSGNNLYGAANAGGTSGYGAIFCISLPVAPPQLTIFPAGANVLLTWPTNASGFSLQSSTSLGSSAIWASNLPTPVAVNGQFTVTNPISGTQQFFRLSQ
jgi:uncharacterized repeat protein (TIGR03803 family)